MVTKFRIGKKLWLSLTLLGVFIILLATASRYTPLFNTEGFVWKQCLFVLGGIILSLFGLVSYGFASEQRWWALTGTKIWRVLSILLFFVFLIGFIGLTFLFLGPSLIYHRPDPSPFAPRQTNQPLTEITIPVQYFPVYEIKDPSRNNREEWNPVIGNAVIKQTSDKIALVLIDTWESSEVETEAPVRSAYKNIAALLEKSRAHGLTIIHAPNRPTVDLYPQYHALRGEMGALWGFSLLKKAFVRWVPPLSAMMDIYKWPPPELSKEAKRLKRNRYLISGNYESTLPEEIRPKHNEELRVRDIYEPFRPRADEFVVESSDEFRYVLRQREIDTILFVGGSIEACISMRPTGVMNLIGSNYVVILMKDGTWARRYPNASQEQVQEIYQTFFMGEMGFVADSKEIIWQRTSR